MIDVVKLKATLIRSGKFTLAARLQNHINNAKTPFGIDTGALVTCRAAGLNVKEFEVQR